MRRNNIDRRSMEFFNWSKDNDLELVLASLDPDAYVE